MPHLQVECDKIRKRILALCAQVEQGVQMANKAIVTRDGALAHKVIMADLEIDEAEVEIEEECLKVLALYQPVAVDLRFLVAIIKINNDLERVGDEAVNIAQRVEALAKWPELSLTFDYSAMAGMVQKMLAYSLDALVKLDLDTAFRVLILDDEVDHFNRQVYETVKESLRKDNSHPGFMINLMLVSRHLERIADHATNIAEEVIMLVEGEILRHRRKELEGEEILRQHRQGLQGNSPGPSSRK
jgi:phosphate transport system protein